MYQQVFVRDQHTRTRGKWNITVKSFTEILIKDTEINPTNWLNSPDKHIIN